MMLTSIAMELSTFFSFARKSRCNLRKILFVQVLGAVFFFCSLLIFVVFSIALQRVQCVFEGRRLYPSRIATTKREESNLWKWQKKRCEGIKKEIFKLKRCLRANGGTGIFWISIVHIFIIFITDACTWWLTLSSTHKSNSLFLKYVIMVWFWQNVLFFLVFGLFLVTDLFSNLQFCREMYRVLANISASENADRSNITKDQCVDF